MGERSLYAPIGRWFIEQKGCQEEPYFRGYTVDPPIAHSGSGNVQKPDLVGVKYERSENATPSFDFHFHIVEVKSGTGPEQIQNLAGEIAMLKQYVSSGNLAADTIQYYIALPTLEIPEEMRDWAEECNVGIITVEKRDGSAVDVRQKSPARIVGNNLSGILSNSDQDSVGRFKDAIRETTVLSSIIDAEDFFRNIIEPEMKAYQNQLDRKNAIQYVNNDSARKAFEEIVTFIETETSHTVTAHNGRSRFALFVEDAEGQKILKMTPQRENFKIYPGDDGNLLFRIAGPAEFEITKDEIDSLNSAKSYLIDNIL